MNLKPWGMSLITPAVFPVRLKRAAETILQTLREQGVPISEALRNPRSILSLVQNTLGPTALRIALYPRAPKHLSLTASPLALARAECNAHRRSLQTLRDERAELLGVLVRMRSSFNPQAPMPFAESLKAAFVLEHSSERPSQGRPRAMSLAPPTLSSTLRKLALVVLPSHQSAHVDALGALRRPHVLVRAWPQLLLAPPLVWAGFHYAADMRVGLMDAVETIKGFWSGYVVAPVKDILDTVRTGRDDGLRLVTPEGLKADMEVRAPLDVHDACPLINLLSSHWSVWPRHSRATSWPIRRSSCSSSARKYARATSGPCSACMRRSSRRPSSPPSAARLSARCSSRCRRRR